MGVTFTNKPNPYAAHLKGSAPQAQITKTAIKNVGKGVKDEQLVSSTTETFIKGPLIPPSVLCHIEVGGGQTISTAPYESARIDVRLTVPCAKDDLNDAYDWASNWVSEKIGEAVAAAKGY
jgi:hypothetical protein